MLDYTKMILSKVSFDEKLFTHELEKAIQNLDSKELITLQQWLLKNYKNQYESVIEDFFEFA